MSDNVVDRGDSIPTTDEEVKVEQVVTQDVAPEVKEPEAKPAEPAAETEEPQRDDKGRFIPKSRFDEAVTKERMARETAERELAALKSQLAQVDKNADIEKIEVEINSLELARAKAVLDGDVEKAAELAGQIRIKERTVRISQEEGVPEKIKEEMREELRWESAVEKLESTYEALRPGTDTYDQDKVDIVLATQKFYVDAKRMTPSAALVLAAEKVMGEAKAPEAKKDGLEAGKNAATDRQKAQIDKNLDTIKKQPADMSDAGLDSDKAGMTKEIDVSKLTSEEFAQLPESTKARLRGDMI